MTAYSFGDVVLVPSTLKPILFTVERLLIPRKLGPTISCPRESHRQA